MESWGIFLFAVVWTVLVIVVVSYRYGEHWRYRRKLNHRLLRQYHDVVLGEPLKRGDE